MYVANFSRIDNRELTFGQRYSTSLAGSLVTVFFTNTTNTIGTKLYAWHGLEGKRMSTDVMAVYGKDRKDTRLIW
jgi:hypothetical protein